MRRRGLPTEIEKINADVVATNIFKELWKVTGLPPDAYIQNQLPGSLDTVLHRLADAENALPRPECAPPVRAVSSCAHYDANPNEPCSRNGTSSVRQVGTQDSGFIPSRGATVRYVEIAPIHLLSAVAMAWVSSNMHQVIQNVQPRLQAPRNHPKPCPGQPDAATNLREPLPATDDWGAPSEVERACVGQYSSRGTKRRCLNESFYLMAPRADSSTIQSSPYAARASTTNLLPGKQPTDSLPSQSAVDGISTAAMQSWCRVEPVPGSGRLEPFGPMAHPPRHGTPSLSALPQQASHFEERKRLPPPSCSNFQGPGQLRQFAMWKPGLQTMAVPRSTGVDNSNQAQMPNMAPSENTSLAPNHSSKNRAIIKKEEANKLKARELNTNAMKSCG